MGSRSYFFCGIGGSGMLPLASYLHASGAEVAGSDRAFDQGRADDVKARLKREGFSIFPQDGSGVTSKDQVLVTSSAVEAQIPDVEAANKVGADKMIRAQLLAEITNAATLSCGVAGTSGKSTTTAMLAHILSELGRDPSVVNGAPILNFTSHEGRPVGWRAGQGPFVCEVDESDGSIALYDPEVGVILNVSEDHKSMEELEVLFGGYAERSRHAVLGIDSPPVAAIADRLPKEKFTTFGLHEAADIRATGVVEGGGRLHVQVMRSGEPTADLILPMIGAFNVSNALGALAAAERLGVPLEEAVRPLAGFKGSARRLQSIGEARGVQVIDDFAHNPEKITGSIGALTKNYRRLHLLYQPHGYGPLKAFRTLYEEAFARALRAQDRLFVTEPVYFGGTVTRTDDAQILVASVCVHGREAHYLEGRESFLRALDEVGEGDAVVVMGARDDSLTTFAQGVLDQLRAG